MNDEVAKKIKKIIVEHLFVSKEQVIDSARFVDDLGADSLDAMDLLLAINEEFGTHIPAERLDDIHTIADMIEAVEEALEKSKKSN